MDGFVERRDTTFWLIFFSVNGRLFPKRLTIFWVKTNGGFEACERSLQIILHRIKLTAPNVVFPVFWAASDCFVQIRNGFLQFALKRENGRAILVGVDAIGIERDRRIIICQCLREFPCR